jgi:hypothetical protein
MTILDFNAKFTARTILTDILSNPRLLIEVKFLRGDHADSNNALLQVK